MSRLKKTFARLRRANECALIPYLTVGFPTIEETVPLARAACESGADVLELGVPFSDPLADGPTIQESSRVALANGVTVRTSLETVAQLRRTGIETPMVLMGYCNPFLAYGVERLAQDAARAGVDGLIVPDLPPDQADRWVTAVNAHDLDLIWFLAPNTAEARLRLVVRQGSGFIYCISVTGVTGARDELPPELPEFLARIQSITDLPLAVGFGISTPRHVRQVSEVADAAIVGSAFINAIRHAAPSERLQTARDFIAQLKAACGRSK